MVCLVDQAISKVLRRIWQMIHRDTDLVEQQPEQVTLPLEFAPWDSMLLLAVPFPLAALAKTVLFMLKRQGMSLPVISLDS